MSRGYKQTELGAIPIDWEIKEFVEVMDGFTSGQTPYRAVASFYKGDIPWITSGELNYNIITDTIEKITPQGVKDANLKMIPKGTFLFAITGLEAAGTRGSCAITGVEATTNQSCMALYPKKGQLITSYLYHYYVRYGNELAFKYCQGTKQQSYTGGVAKKLPIILPPTIEEQTAIATALSDTDALITSLEKLIAKKRNIKQGAMQELLKPKKGWEVKRLGEIVDVLDNLRKPLNDATRQKMKGDIPYCGANSVVGYVDDYLIDDDIILMAEDGGYFDEYKTRAIAYKMQGKCWVNNHAHILKSKKGINQDFVFYSIVHKNILDFINGGTRAKLNKSELLNIPIQIAARKSEQDEVAEILLEMDSEIICLETKLEKYRQIKSGMMQNLLTGKIRLV